MRAGPGIRYLLDTSLHLSTAETSKKRLRTDQCNTGSKLDILHTSS